MKSVHWHFGSSIRSSIRKNLLCISYKKGAFEEIKSARKEFFPLIHYVYVTYRYNLDEFKLVLIVIIQLKLLVRKHNN
jgi:hypothetical protein